MIEHTVIEHAHGCARAKVVITACETAEKKIEALMEKADL